MPVDKKTLTKSWIQYLKNNKIVELNSDPETGNLRYRRPVTSSDLSEFLEAKTDFSPEEISNALHMVLAKNAIDKQSPKLPPKQPGTGLSTWMYYGMTPGDKPEPAEPPEPAAEPDIKRISGTTKRPSQIAHDPNSVTDVDYKDIESDDPQLKKGKKAKRFNEDIKDQPSVGNLSEKDVEAIFGMLSSGQAKKKQPETSSRADRASAVSPDTAKGTVAEPSDEETEAKKQEDLRKLKRLIRDVMTDSQRKSLWRMLNDQQSITESQLNNADIKAILSAAADKRNNPTGFGKIFKGLRKDKIDVNDLQQSWKEQGFPDDTRDINALLLSHGFSEKEIKKVFSDVFGSYKSSDKDDSADIPGQTPTMIKIVDYAKKNNLTQDLIQFMQSEYGFKESIEQYGNKLVIEDIRRIFSAIVHEERSARAELIKVQDKTQLGRTKK